MGKLFCWCVVGCIMVFTNYHYSVNMLGMTPYEAAESTSLWCLGSAFTLLALQGFAWKLIGAGSHFFVAICLALIAIGVGVNPNIMPMFIGMIGCIILSIPIVFLVHKEPRSYTLLEFPSVMAMLYAPIVPVKWLQRPEGASEDYTVALVAPLILLAISFMLLLLCRKGNARAKAKVA